MTGMADVTSRIFRWCGAVKESTEDWNLNTSTVCSLLIKAYNQQTLTYFDYISVKAGKSSQSGGQVYRKTHKNQQWLSWSQLTRRTPDAFGFSSTQ